MKDPQQTGTKAQPSLWLFMLALLVALAVPMITAGLLSWHSLGELDVWLHQKAGQEILQGQGFSASNTYSYTEPDHAWTNHEWLFQVLIAATGPGPDDLEAGINRWILLRLALTLFLMSMLLLSDRPWRTPPIGLLWLAPGLFLGVALLWSRILLRPELLSYALLILLIRFAQLPPSGFWSWRQLISPRTAEGLAFYTTLFWAQLHGFSSLAPVIWLLAGLWGYIPHSNFRRIPAFRLAAGTLWLLVALLLTPNGWKGLVYPLQALGQFSEATVNLQSTISELQPLLQTPDGFGFTLLAFKISLLWGLVHIALTWPRRNLLRITLWVLAAAATLAAQRNLGFYAITFVMLQTDSFAMENLNFRWARRTIHPATAAVPALAVLAATIWFWPALVSDDFYLAEGQSRRFGSGPTVARYPFKATQVLARAPGTRVFANVDAASLTLSRGQAKVFIDGRTEAYSPETWNQYHQLRQAGPQALRILDQTNTRNVLLTLGGNAFHPLLQTLLMDPQWMVRQAGPSGVLFFRPAKEPLPPKQNPLMPFARLQPQSPQPHLSPTRQADLLGAQATLYQLAGDIPQMEAALIKGLDLKPTHPLLNHNLGNLLLGKKQPAQALDHFQQALATNSRLAGSALNGGVCLMQMSDFHQAQKMFATAGRLQPDNFQVWVNLSLALQQLDRHQEAVAAMEKAAVLNPGSSRIRKALQDLESQF